MRRWVALALLTCVVVGAFIAAVQIASTDLGSYLCDGPASIVLNGQSEYYGSEQIDPAVVARCTEAAQTPGTAVLVTFSIGLAAAIAWLAVVVLIWRDRNPRATGEPISRPEQGR